MNSDEILMEVNIAGERISLSVPFSRQEAVRNTETELSMLYRKFGETFPKKSPKELLAMVAYRFASSYFDLLKAREKDLSDVSQLLDDVERLCGDNSDDVRDHFDMNEFPLY